ncbi:MAG: DUF6600 domain-containing protein [Candidatus Deferrimicrobium sp.]
MEAPRRATLASYSLAIALSVLAATALSSGARAEEEITPSTAIARLMIVKGTAWVRHVDSGEWEENSHNSPVVERSRVSIPRDSESEIQFRGSQYLLLQGGSEVDVRQLGERKVSFGLRSGQIAFSLSKEDFAPVTVKLPGNRDVSLEAPGLYWLTVGGEATKLNVRRGEGTVSREGAQFVTVKGGEEASIGKEVRVSKAGPAAEPNPAPEATLTDEERNAGIPGAAATELREYGEWVWTSEYGYVWRPYVADDWAPYYYGRWSWVYPYGWNWVGYEPWGWWPYHYGWWVSVASWGWVWAPCNTFYSAGYHYRGYPYGYRYGYYNPANVRFVNDGRYVRWIPEQPGRATTRGAAFSRTDTRLAQWDRPMPGGTVASRGSGGRISAAGGKVPAPSSARRGVGRTGRETVARSAGRKSAHPFTEGGGRVSAVPPGSGAPGRSAGGGKAPSRFSAHGGPGRAPVRPGGAAYGRGGEPRSAGRGYAYPSTRVYDTGHGSYGTAPRGSFGAGYRTPGGAARSFGGGGSRGFGGGGGGGFRGGGGARTR